MFALVVRKKYVNGFYPSAGNVFTGEMYLVNANFFLVLIAKVINVKPSSFTNQTNLILHVA